MATNSLRQKRAYGLASPLLKMAPEPIVAQRAPTTNDFAEIGTIWIDKPNNDSYILTSVVNNSASWINSGGGTGTFAALTVNPGDATITAGNLDVTAGNIAAGGTGHFGGLLTAAAGIDIANPATITAATDTQASPTAASTLNVNVGSVTFTGFTTASGATEAFTITNSLATATSQIFVSASNEGANDAQMTVTRVNRGAGSFVVTLTNNGAAALNGDIALNFWLIG